MLKFRLCICMSCRRNRTLDFRLGLCLLIFKLPARGSLKISRRNPCSPFFSVSYSINPLNRHKILQYLFSTIPPRGSVRVGSKG